MAIRDCDHRELRPHQLKCVETLIHNPSQRGKIILPTGTGKTLIEIDLLRRNIRRLQLAKKYGGYYLVLSPRILLTFQLLQETISYLSAKKIGCQYLNVNSGEFATEELIRLMARIGLQPERVPSTTSHTEVRRIAELAKLRKEPLIIGCTYHSAAKVIDAMQQMDGKLCIITYDEAQYTVDSGRFSETAEFSAKRRYFFTATPRTTNSIDGLGMNNTARYGNVLFQRTPRQMIEAGEMVGPAVHLVGVHGDYVGIDLTRDYKSRVNSIRDAFNEHRMALAKYSSDPSKLAPKLLVTEDGQQTLKGIVSTPEFRDWPTTMPGVKVYMISTDFGIYLNGIHHPPPVTNRLKEDLLLALQDLKPTDESIIIHVDMLAEGIDVPGITGMMPFRNLGKEKFLQNMGRATRLHLEDRTKLYSGIINPSNHSDYIKRYAWLVLPVFMANAQDSMSRNLELIEQLRYEYQFDSSELIVVDNTNAMPEEPEIPEAGEGPKHSVANAGAQVVDFVHDLEDAEFIGSLTEKTFMVKKMTQEEMLSRLIYKTIGA